MLMQKTYHGIMWSVVGGIMVPISWTEMQCPLTGQIERRKVAKGN